jgi:hypothetical protein
LLGRSAKRRKKKIVHVSWETKLCIVFYILLQEKMLSLQTKVLFRVADKVPEIIHSRVSLWSPTYGVVALEGVVMICDDNEDLPRFPVGLELSERNNYCNSVSLAIVDPSPFLL